MQIKNKEITLKYFEALDTFVKVCTCEADHLHALVEKNHKISREDYINGVISECFPHYDTELKAHIEALQTHLDPMSVVEMKEDLYQLALQVNPHLKISRVSIALSKAGKTETTTQTETAETPPTFEFNLKDLNKKLRSVVMGQDEAIDTLCQNLKRAAVGLNGSERPLGSFLLVGNTGVGKTQLAKALATEMFGGLDHLIRLDGSEYSQAHECAKLIGSPPGYIGHDSGGVLTEAVRKQPHAVVLFDEIEKADSKVHNMLLQILDEGRLTDSQGQTVSFENCVLIMTSNLGLKDSLRAQNGPGFAKVEAPTLEFKDLRSVVNLALQEFFSPEFLNRIDNTVHFNNLTTSHSEDITRKFLSITTANLKNNGFDVIFSNAVIKKVAAEGFDERFGARGIKRKILDFVENPLSDEIIQGNVIKGTPFEAEVEEDKIIFKRTA